VKTSIRQGFVSIVGTELCLIFLLIFKRSFCPRSCKHFDVNINFFLLFFLVFIKILHLVAELEVLNLLRVVQPQ